MNVSRSYALAPVIALAAGSALADDHHHASGGAPLSGLYITGSAALSIYPDADGVGTGTNSETFLGDPFRTLEGQVGFKPGFAIRGAIGWDFGEFKTEFESVYQRYGIDNVFAFDPSEVALAIDGGDSSGVVDNFDSAINLVTVGVNGYYAPRYGDFRPFVGIGAGYTPIIVEDIDVEFNGIDFSFDDPKSDGIFSVNFTGGLDYQITDRFSVGGQYRYIWSTDVEIRDSASDQRIEIDRRAHEFGLRATYALWDPLGGDALRDRPDFNPPPMPTGGDSATAAQTSAPPQTAVATAPSHAPVAPTAASSRPTTRMGAATPARMSAAKTPYRVQLGAFGDAKNADRLVARLAADGFAPTREQKGRLQIVYAGTFPSRSAADAAAARARGYTGEAVVVRR